MIVVNIKDNTATVENVEDLSGVSKAVVDQALSIKPAIDKGSHYLEWFMDQHNDADEDNINELLKLVANHTQRFGQAQFILHELDNISGAFENHRHRGKAAKAAHDKLRVVALSVWLAKVIKEGFGEPLERP